MTCMRSMTNGCHGGSTADGRNRKSPAPPSSASAATSTRPPPCASIGVYSYTPILAGDAPPPLLHEQVVPRLASQALNRRPFLGRANTKLCADLRGEMHANPIGPLPADRRGLTEYVKRLVPPPGCRGCT